MINKKLITKNASEVRSGISVLMSTVIILHVTSFSNALNIYLAHPNWEIETTQFMSKCSSRDMAGDGRNKHHVVLVHGSCHGAWCWFKVATLLKSAGYRVTAPDLAASGIDTRRIEEVATLADYSQPLLDIMAALPHDEKVILVGHSFGGLSIALAADMFPAKVAAAVFVAAFMPDCASSPSSSLKALLRQYPDNWWMDSQFKDHGEKTFHYLLFGPELMASKFYQLCLPEDLTLARTLARPTSFFMEDLESLPPFAEDRYGSVPRFYIVCSDDAAILTDYQRSMIQNYPVTRALEIHGADHMVMMSRPQELFRSLARIAADIDD